MSKSFRATVIALLALVALLLAGNLWRLSSPPPPDPRLVDVSVRSTLFALPTATARVEIVTRVVVATPSPTMAPSATPGPTATPVSSAPVLAGAAAFVAAEPTAQVPAAGVAETGAGQAAAPANESAPPTPPDPTSTPPPEPSAPSAASCPSGPGRAYDAIPVAGGGIEHPDSIHGDLNLWQRGWSPVDAARAVVDIDGPADSDPPQLVGVLDGRLPAFSSTAQVYDWNWSCGAHGCRGELMTHREVMLVGLSAAPGEAVHIPSRGAQIYGGGYKALVLYAEPTRVTLGYTREDSLANGYAVHIENVCVDPGLVALYQETSAGGRGRLPALREGETLGTASMGDILVAVRDRGVFLDPRSRKDWWRGF